MKTLIMFKIQFATNHFNKNQKVWVRRGSGSMAAEVRGRFRGRGRYVTCWVDWRKKGRVPPELKDIKVADRFYEKIRGGCESSEWYATR